MPSNTTNNQSFSVLIAFSIQQSNIPIQSLIAWINDWIDNNMEWSRQWNRSDGIYTEILYYNDSFCNYPYIIPDSIKKPNNNLMEFVVQFDCTSKSQHWKDWVSKFYSDIKSSYPTILRKRGIQIIPD